MPSQADGYSNQASFGALQHTTHASLILDSLWRHCWDCDHPLSSTTAPHDPTSDIRHWTKLPNYISSNYKCYLCMNINNLSMPCRICFALIEYDEMISEIIGSLLFRTSWCQLVKIKPQWAEFPLAHKTMLTPVLQSKLCSSTLQKTASMLRVVFLLLLFQRLPFTGCTFTAEKR